MAIFDVGPNYTRTGNTDAPGIANWIQGAANKISVIPFGGLISFPIGMLGSIIESAGWLFKGKFASAATALGAGFVGHKTNALMSANPFNWGYLLQLGSGVGSKTTLGTHARAATEAVVGGALGLVGQRPTVLRSYTAGVGSINSGPGAFATRVAQERGQDPRAMHAAYRSGAGAEHVAALEASRAQGAYRGV